MYNVFPALLRSRHFIVVAGITQRSTLSRRESFPVPLLSPVISVDLSIGSLTAQNRTISVITDSSFRLISRSLSIRWKSLASRTAVTGTKEWKNNVLNEMRMRTEIGRLISYRYDEFIVSAFTRIFGCKCLILNYFAENQ